MQFYVLLNEHGRVIHRIEQPEGWPRGEGYVLESGQPYEPGPVPESITPRQMRLWLLSQDAGGGKTMLDTAVTYINQPTDVIERRQQQVAWEFATSIQRNDPLTIAISNLLGLSSAQTDQAFREAALL